MQNIWRDSLQGPHHYRTMVAEEKEEARVNTKTGVLQKRLLAYAELNWIKADKVRIQAEKKPTGAAVDDDGPDEAHQDEDRGEKD